LEESNQSDDDSDDEIMNFEVDSEDDEGGDLKCKYLLCYLFLTQDCYLFK